MPVELAVLVVAAVMAWLGVAAWRDRDEMPRFRTGHAPDAPRSSVNLLHLGEPME